MEKIKKKQDSLPKAFIKYLIVGIISAILGSSIIGNLSNKGQDYYLNKYNKNGTGEISEVPIKLYNEKNEFVMIYHQVTSWQNSRNEMIYNIISNAQIIVIPLWVLLCLFLVSKRFYRKRLNQPIAELVKASEKIANSDLDFKMEYHCNDEIGMLCTSFETMRRTLEENNRQMWRQIEERKRLNAAFAHDLRTPLTVIKAQNELILKYLPEDKITTEKMISSTYTMHTHIQRMEQYVETMSCLLRLEDIPILKEKIDFKEIMDNFKICVSAIEHQLREVKKGIIIEWNISKQLEFVYVDKDILQQVFDNLLSNAIRFANTKIRITVTKSLENTLLITVSDDGVGFSHKDLKFANTPFYTTSKKAHFGMGLYICRVLCEKHGGMLCISNTQSGAKVDAYFSFL